MNLDSLVEWAVVVVLAFAATGHLDDLQRLIWREQAKVVYASRTSTWGTPNMWNRSKPNSVGFNERSDR